MAQIARSPKDRLPWALPCDLEWREKENGGQLKASADG